MSIINDALKKTQMSFKRPKKKDKKEEAQPVAKKEDEVVNVYDKLYKAKEEKSGSSSGAMADKRTGKSKSPSHAKKITKTILVTIFFIVSLAFSYKFLSGYEPLQDFIRSKTGKRRSSRHFIAKHVPKKRTYKPGDLVLNGISIIDGQKVALINDEIYQIGDTVSNKEIISIGRGEVKLQDDDKIYTIKVR